MKLLDSAKTDLRDCCRKISRILGLTQGSIEIHCHKGEPKQLHIHDKSIKFEESKDG
jgi:hypothetical protein